MDYQRYFDNVSSRYYSFLCCRLDRYIRDASDKEYAALMFFCGSDEFSRDLSDPFEKDLFFWFSHYYKLNPENAINKLVIKLPELKDEHLQIKSKYPKVISKSLRYYKVINGNWFEKYIGKVSYLTEYDFGNYHTLLLNEFSIEECLRFLIKEYVYERVNLYSRDTYAFIQGLEEKANLLLERFQLRHEEDQRNPLVNDYGIEMNWWVSKRSVIDFLSQLRKEYVEAKVEDKIESKPVLEINNRNFEKLIKFIDKRFKNDSTSTILDMLKPNKHKPARNRIKINIIPKEENI